jgi:hypothetical protein
MQQLMKGISTAMIDEVTRACIRHMFLPWALENRYYQAFSLHPDAIRHALEVHRFQHAYPLRARGSGGLN